MEYRPWPLTVCIERFALQLHSHIDATANSGRPTVNTPAKKTVPHADLVRDKKPHIQSVETTGFTCTGVREKFISAKTLGFQAGQPKPALRFATMGGLLN
jgi:hypothetical protein